MRTPIGVLLVASLLGGSAPAVREIPTPAAPGSGQVSLTATADGRMLLSWVEPSGSGDKRHALRFATRGKGGAWSAAATIAEGENWFVNWADFPSMASLPDGTLFAHWLAKSAAGTYSYDVNVSVSRDGGKSWSRPVVPHRDGTQTEHGFVSMTPGAAGAMGIAWLDGRNSAGGHDGHGGAMSLMHTSIGSDGRLGTEALLDRRVCDCCQTDAVRADGATVVVYRDRSDKEVRDISFVRFAESRWSEPRTIAHDGWQINGCPVNGPAIAASGRHVGVAWFTMAAGTPRVNLAFSKDAGATFGPPVAVDDGKPLGRVDVVVLGTGAALVSWLEQGDGGASVRVRRVRADAARGESLTVAETSPARSSGFPRMLASGGEVVLAWRDGSQPPRIRTALLTGVD